MRTRGLPWWFNSKESACNAGAAGHAGSMPGLGRSPGGEHGNPLQCSFLKNSMDRGAWQAIVHRMAKSRTWPKRPSAHTRMRNSAIAFCYSVKSQLLKPSFLPCVTSPQQASETLRWALRWDQRIKKSHSFNSPALELKALAQLRVS